MLPLAVDEYRGAVVGFDKAETEWLRRATLRMIGNIGVELLRTRRHSRMDGIRLAGSTAVASISSRALRLDQPGDLDHRHGREMPAHHLAIGGAERGQVGEILVDVADVPGQPHDVLRLGAGFRQHRGDVLERELHLRDEAVGEAALAVLADHAADEHHLAAREDAVGEALRPRPAGRLQHGVECRAFGH